MTVQISKYLGQDGNCLVHMCPGCGFLHRIDVYGPNPHTGARWTFNGDVECPTFSPSINRVGVCHYFIVDGRIRYCADSRHELAGQDMPLPPLPSDLDLV